MNFIRFGVKTQSSINILLKFKVNYLQAKEHKMYQILFIYWNQVIFSQIQSWKRLFVIGSRSHKKPYYYLKCHKIRFNIFNIFCSALAEIRCFKVYFDQHGKDILWLIIRLHNFIILTTVADKLHIFFGLSFSWYVKFCFNISNYGANYY